MKPIFLSIFLSGFALSCGLEPPTAVTPAKSVFGDDTGSNTDNPAPAPSGNTDTDTSSGNDTSQGGNNTGDTADNENDNTQDDSGNTAATVFSPKSEFPDAFNLCTACHGADGKGQGDYPSIVNSEISTSFAFLRDGQGGMPPYNSSQISNEDFAQVYANISGQEVDLSTVSGLGE